MTFHRAHGAILVVVFVGCNFLYLSVSVVTMKRTPPGQSTRSLLSVSTPDVGNLTRKAYRLPESAEWCYEPTEAPLPYEECPRDDFLPEVILQQGSGMCSIFANLLDVSIWAFASGFCFHINEEKVLLRDQSMSNSTFINRYFEPIGLPQDSKLVEAANKPDSSIHRADYFYHKDPIRFGRQLYKHVATLGYFDVHKEKLRKTMIRRMMRFLPETRNKTCTTLESHNLPEPFIAFSIRRGDKTTAEKHVDGVSSLPTMDKYILAAEDVAKKHFAGEVPPIFVASDDCSVLPILRTVRPTWRFESECDRHSATGYELSRMKSWSQEMLDEHFEKFFVELIAMATSKVFIGVSYTNVAFLVYWMRQQADETFILLDGTIASRIP